MKTLLSLFIFALSLTATAQVKVTTTDLKDVQAFADSVTTAINHPLTLAMKGENADTNGRYVFEYFAPSDVERKEPLQLSFRVYETGYSFDSATGTFNDLFPVWKRYFNKVAKAENITGSNVTDYQSDTITIGDKRYTFKYWGTFWKIISNRIN
jgi:hypothetical protein